LRARPKIRRRLAFLGGFRYNIGQGEGAGGMMKMDGLGPNLQTAQRLACRSALGISREHQYGKQMVTDGSGLDRVCFSAVLAVGSGP
jgi:hypothetical protein